jgi:hypothetical protein
MVGLPAVCGSSFLKPEVAASGFSHFYIPVIITDCLWGTQEVLFISRLAAIVSKLAGTLGGSNERNYKEIFQDLF